MNFLNKPTVFLCRFSRWVEWIFILGLISVSTTSFATVKIQHWVSSQGVSIYYAQAPGIPMVDVQVVFDAGSARDGKQYGLAAMTSNLLDRGAGKWNADKIS